MKRRHVSSKSWLVVGEATTDVDNMSAKCREVRKRDLVLFGRAGDIPTQHTVRMLFIIGVASHDCSLCLSCLHAGKHGARDTCILHAIGNGVRALGCGRAIHLLGTAFHVWVVARRLHADGPAACVFAGRTGHATQRRVTSLAVYASPRLSLCSVRRRQTCHGLGAVVHGARPDDRVGWQRRWVEGLARISYMYIFSMAASAGLTACFGYRRARVIESNRRAVR